MSEETDIVQVDFCRPDGQWLRYYCAELRELSSAAFVLMDVRRETQVARETPTTVRSGSVKVGGFPYTAVHIPKPAWWDR